MKLQTALSLLIWGTSTSYGHAFASTPSLSGAVSSSLSSIAFMRSSKDPLPFVTKSIARGGAITTPPSTSSSVLSATVDDAVTDTCPETVVQYISAENWSLLSARGKQALTNLIVGDEGIGAQEHVYKGWPEAGVDDEGKVSLTEQVRNKNNTVLLQTLV